MRENIAIKDGCTDARQDPPPLERRRNYNKRPTNRAATTLLDDYTVYETFDPNGPQLAECVVRILSDGYCLSHNIVT